MVDRDPTEQEEKELETFAKNKSAPFLEKFHEGKGFSSLYSYTQRLLGRWGFTDHVNLLPQKHLPESHPSLAKLRNYIDSLAATGEIHERLIGNFDQVCTANFKPANRVLYKDAAKEGMKFSKKIPAREEVKRLLLESTAVRSEPSLAWNSCPRLPRLLLLRLG